MRITLPPASTKGRNIRRGVARLAIKSHITSTQSRASVGFFRSRKSTAKRGAMYSAGRIRFSMADRLFCLPGRPRQALSPLYHSRGKKQAGLFVDLKKPPGLTPGAMVL